MWYDVAAIQEADLGQKVFEEKRQLHIEKQNRERERADILYQMKIKKEEVIHSQQMQVLCHLNDMFVYVCCSRQQYKDINIENWIA